MTNCQYIAKKAFLRPFFVIGAVLCLAPGAYAQVTIKAPEKPPAPVVTIKPPAPIAAPASGISSLEIQKVVDDAMKVIDAKIEEEKAAEKKKVVEKFAPNSPQFAIAMSGVDAAFMAIREGARMRVTEACAGLKCDSDRIRAIAEAYVTKKIASDFFSQYASFVAQSITDTEKQRAEMRRTMELFDSKITEGRNGWGYRLFGDVFGELNQAGIAREQARQITMRVQATYDRLNEMQALFTKLQAGIGGTSLSEEEALKLIGKIKILLADIERSTAEILPYLSKPELIAIVAKHAPDIDLKAKAIKLEQISGQIKAKIKDFETDKAKEMQKQLFKVLPIPVDLTKPLPQLVMPKPSGNPASNPVSIDPFVAPPATSPASPLVPSMKPPVTAPVTYRLSWPLKDGSGKIIRYDIFEYPSSLPAEKATPYNGLKVQSMTVPAYR